MKREEGDKAAVTFVQSLLERREKYEKIVREAFKNDKELLKTLKEAFEHIVNMDSKVPHFLSLYVDELMKKRAKKKGNAEQNLDEVLDKVIVIFRHLLDKDVFEDFYKKLLAKRLLLKKRTFDSEFSFDAEERFITKLKAECGQQFTSKLEAMIKDMKMSSTLMTDFKASVKLKTKMQLEVNVLTTGSWPDTGRWHIPRNWAGRVAWFCIILHIIPGEQMCNLPENIQAMCDAFKEYYLNKYDGRKLSWQTNLGNAEVKGNFYTPHTLIVSTYQMVILLLFNESPTLAYEEIKDRTKIPEAELKRHLISLAAPKYKVLVKQPKGKSIHDDHTFTFNAKYNPELTRVRIPLVSSRAPSKQSKAQEVPKQVENDRKHLIEAAIVRIMKARKQLSVSSDTSSGVCAPVMKVGGEYSL